MNSLKIHRIRRLYIFIMLLVVVPCYGQAPAEAPAMEERIEVYVREVQRGAMELAERIAAGVSGRSSSRIYLGVALESIPKALRDHIDIPAGVGLIIAHVVPNSPAQEAGLLESDILLELDGQKIVNLSQLSALLNLHGGGAEVEILILRKGEQLVLPVVLRERQATGSGALLNRDLLPQSIRELDQERLLGNVDTWIQGVEEWLPGSVRVLVDDKQQVQIDLSELKDDLAQLRLKFLSPPNRSDEEQTLVQEHGDIGARTTKIHLGEKSIQFSSPAGSVVLRDRKTGRHATIHDVDGRLLFRGSLTESAIDELSADARALLDAAEESQLQMQSSLQTEDMEIELSSDVSDPTF